MLSSKLDNIKEVRVIEKNYPSIHLLGVRIDDLPLDTLVNLIVQKSRLGEKVTAAYVNIYALNLAYEKPWFKDWLNASDIAYCDGYGARIGARLLGLDLKNRNTPPDWIDSLASACASQGLSIFFLGGQAGVAELAAGRLSHNHPDLRIAGVQHGYFEKTYRSAESARVIKSINQSDADILLVGFGMPVQEKWLLENREGLDARVAMPVGALFDYLGGVIPRAPRSLTKNGFEWLGRLMYEPGRLWRRYLVGAPLFFTRVLSQRLFRK